MDPIAYLDDLLKSKNGVKWITVHGAHIPIKNGEMYGPVADKIRSGSKEKGSALDALKKDPWKIQGDPTKGTQSYVAGGGRIKLTKEGKKWTLSVDGKKHEMPRKPDFGHAEGIIKEHYSKSGPIEALDALLKAAGKHPFSESQRRWAFHAEQQGKLPKGKALTWSRRVKGEDLPESTDEDDKPKKGKKAEKSMADPIEELDRLVKGHIPETYSQNQPAALPDDRLYDYLCAQIEEACEHEGRERMHASIPLEGEDRVRDLTQAVFHELVQKAEWNVNMRRALELHSVTQDTVEQIMRDKGLLRTKNENYNAERDARQSGYQPGSMRLSFVRVVDDSPDPVEVLRKSQQDFQKRVYGSVQEGQVVKGASTKCPHHGLDPMGMNFRHVYEQCCCGK